MDASQWLDWLEGQWRISRRVESENATLHGSATFSRIADDVLDYAEKGLLTLHNGQTIRASRRYTFLARGESVVIEFADGPDLGKPFVELLFNPSTAGVLRAADTHYCGEDTYSVTFQMSLPDAYETDIAVSGPSKSYRAITRYRRIYPSGS